MTDFLNVFAGWLIDGTGGHIRENVLLNVQNGQIDDAQWEIEQILMLTPELTLSVVAKLYSMMDPALSKVYIKDLRQAGLPD